jgi:hypothetical protein
VPVATAHTEDYREQERPLPRFEKEAVSATVTPMMSHMYEGSPRNQRGSVENPFNEHSEALALMDSVRKPPTVPLRDGDISVHQDNYKYIMSEARMRKPQSMYLPPVVETPPDATHISPQLVGYKATAMSRRPAEVSYPVAKMPSRTIVAGGADAATRRNPSQIGVIKPDELYLRKNKPSLGPMFAFPEGGLLSTRGLKGAR